MPSPVGSKHSKNGSETKANVLTTTANDLDTELLINASPRPGGYIKILVPPRDQDYGADSSKCVCPEIACKDAVSKQSTVEPQFSSFNPSSHDTTRNFRISKALEESDWEKSTTVDDTDMELDDLGEDAAAAAAEKPKVNLLAIAISTVMLLAAEQEVAKDQMNAALAYLECIRDENDDLPPNIQGLINHIGMLNGGEIVHMRNRSLKKPSTERTPSNANNLRVLSAVKSK